MSCCASSSSTRPRSWSPSPTAIKGNPETADLGHKLVSKIRQVRGVVAVDDKLAYPPAERSVAGLYF